MALNGAWLDHGHWGHERVVELHLHFRTYAGNTQYCCWASQKAGNTIFIIEARRQSVAIISTLVSAGGSGKISFPNRPRSCLKKALNTPLQMSFVLIPNSTGRR